MNENKSQNDKQWAKDKRIGLQSRNETRPFWPTVLLSLFLSSSLCPSLSSNSFFFFVTYSSAFHSFLSHDCPTRELAPFCLSRCKFLALLGACSNFDRSHLERSGKGNR